MEELHKIAEAFYNTATEEHKAKGNNFFEGMDQDGDGQIAIQEFLACMKGLGHNLLANRQFFDALNKNGTGKLDFWEVMTLLYIIQSGRKHCDGCGEFLKGTFFSCTHCFAHNDASYNLCYPCFSDRKYVHDHMHFLDNYLLLETRRSEALNEKNTQMEAETKKLAIMNLQVG